MAYCRECGSPLRQGARFCGECGTLIDASPQREEDVRGAGSTDARRPRDTVADLGRRVTDALERFMDAPDEPGSFVACTWSEDPGASVVPEASAVATVRTAAAAVGAAQALARDGAGRPAGETGRRRGERVEGSERHASTPPKATVATDAIHQAGGPTCPHCGASVSADARFCRTCGREIALPKGPVGDGRPRCPHCGQEVSAGARFCRTCGHALG